MGEGARLARTGTGEDQQRPLPEGDRLALRAVQVGEQALDLVRPDLGRGAGRQLALAAVRRRLIDGAVQLCLGLLLGGGHRGEEGPRPGPSRILRLLLPEELRAGLEDPVLALGVIADEYGLEILVGLRLELRGDAVDRLGEALSSLRSVS